MVKSHTEYMQSLTKQKPRADPEMEEDGEEKEEKEM